MKCDKCRLSETCENILQMGHGSRNARIMLIQENPYEEENKRGTYLGGKAGRLWRSAMSEVGLDIDDVFYTAVVKCSSPQNRLPLADEVKACEDYLWAEIEVIKPEIIVPTGNISLKLLSGLTGITKQRGKLVEKDGMKILPIIHPNLVLKQPKYMEMFSEDMTTLESILNGTKVETRSSASVERRYCDTFEEAVDEVKRLLRLPSGSRLVVDLETTKANAHKSKVTISERMKAQFPESEFNRIVAIGFSDRPGYGCAIPLYHRENNMSGNRIGTIVKLIRVLLEREDIEVIAQNGKFEMKWLRAQLGIDIKNMAWDTMLMHYLAVTEEKGTHGLDDFAWQYTDMGGYDSELNAHAPKGELDKGNYDMVPWDVLKKYLAGDCDCTMRVFEKLHPLVVENEDFKWIWDNLMVPGYKTLCDIEHDGAFVDEKWLSRLEKTYPEEIERIQQRLRDYPEVVQMEREFLAKWNERQHIATIKKADRTEEQQEKFNKYKRFDPATGGCKINFASNDQLRELLLGRMGLKTNVLTDKGEEHVRMGNKAEIKHYSTNDDSLKYMQKQHLIVETLLEYRKVNHLYNNFVSGMREHMDDRGFVHPNFNLHGTVCVTGDTMVRTHIGDVRIDCLVPIGEPKTFHPLLLDLLVYDGETYRKPLAGFYGGWQEIRTITTDSGYSISGTLEHRLYSTSGWVYVKDIRIGQTLKCYDPLNTENTCVVVDISTGFGEVFDLCMDNEGDDFDE